MRAGSVGIKKGSLLPICGFMSQHGFLCYDMILRPGARLGLGAHERLECATCDNGAHDNATHDNTACERQSFLALCCDKDLCVATMFPGELGVLGRDRGLLYHDRDFSTLCHDRNSVSR